MGKYIDADKLKVELEMRKTVYIGHALSLRGTNLIDGFDEATYHDYAPNGARWFEEVLVNHNSQGGVACPTLQMAIKWLREIHKLDIDVSIEYKNSKKVYYYSVLKKTVIRDIDCLHSETNFDSYEQACEAAIKYCLENLI